MRPTLIFIEKADAYCPRCRRLNPDSLTMSRFNTQMICPACEDAERAHPKYAEAAEAELLQCMMGNFNYEGIGLPPELEGGGHGKKEEA